MTGGAVHPDLVALFPTVVRRAAGTGAGESFLAYALDQHALVAVSDVQGKILYVNDRFAEISGYAKEELLGRFHSMLKSGEHSKAFYQDLWTTITSGESWTGEIKNIRKNGEPYWVKATIVPFFSPNGKPEKFLSIHTDITEIKSAEAQMQRQLSFDLIKDEIYLFWPDSLHVFYTNRSARIRLRALGTAMANLTPFKLLHGISEVELRNRLAPLAAGKRRWTTFEAAQQRPDGRTTPAEVTIQLIRPKDESPRFLAHVRNISQRKEAETAKRQFVANVSHELRTPLTAIKGAFGLITAGQNGSGEVNAGQLAEMGLKNTSRLERLIEDLLDMERIASGRVVSSLEPLDMVELIAAALDELGDYLPEKRVRIDYLGDEEPLCVKGDELGLLKVMVTLLTNAVKFSHDGGEVAIRAQRDGARVVVSVADRGIGIPEHAMKSIFMPFTQADESDQRCSGGAGLGLSIARAIIEEHGGSIDVKSTEGEGTEVSFCLIPCTEDTASD